MSVWAYSIIYIHSCGSRSTAKQVTHTRLPWILRSQPDSQNFYVIEKSKCCNKQFDLNKNDSNRPRMWCKNHRHTWSLLAFTKLILFNELRFPVNECIVNSPEIRIECLTCPKAGAHSASPYRAEVKGSALLIRTKVCESDHRTDC